MCVHVHVTCHTRVHQSCHCVTCKYVTRLAYVTHVHTLIFGHVTRSNAWHASRTRHASCVYMYMMRHVASVTVNSRTHITVKFTNFCHVICVHVHDETCHKRVHKSCHCVTCKYVTWLAYVTHVRTPVSVWHEFVNLTLTWVREFDCDMSSWVDWDTSSWIWRWLAYVTHGHALVFGHVTRPNVWHDSRTRHESCVYMCMRHVMSWVSVWHEFVNLTVTWVRELTVTLAHVMSWVMCVYTSMRHVHTWLMCCAWVVSHIQHMSHVCTWTCHVSCTCTHMTRHTRVHFTSRSGLCQLCRCAPILNSEFYHLFMYWCMCTHEIFDSSIVRGPHSIGHCYRQEQLMSHKLIQDDHQQKLMSHKPIQQIFDSSIVRGTPLDFVIGQGQVWSSSATSCRKSPIFCQKSPSFYEKSPICINRYSSRR